MTLCFYWRNLPWFSWNIFFEKKILICRHIKAFSYWAPTLTTQGLIPRHIGKKFSVNWNWNWMQVKFKLKISQLIDVVSFLGDRRKKRNVKLNNTFGFEVKRHSTVQYAKELWWGGGGKWEQRAKRGVVAPDDFWNWGEWGLKEYKWKGPSLVGSLGLSSWHKSFLFCLGWYGRPSKKYFFFKVYYFNSLVPITQQARQAVVLGRLSLCMCLWMRKTKIEN